MLDVGSFLKNSQYPDDLFILLAFPQKLDKNSFLIKSVINQQIHVSNKEDVQELTPFDFCVNWAEDSVNYSGYTQKDFKYSYFVFLVGKEVVLDTEEKGQIVGFNVESPNKPLYFKSSLGTKNISSDNIKEIL